MSRDLLNQAGYELRRCAELIRDERRREQPLAVAPNPVRDPAFMLAVAEWLESMAGSHIHVGGREVSTWDMPGVEHNPALKLARLIVGEDSDA